MLVGRMSKETDAKILKDIAGLTAFCETDRRDALAGAEDWRNIPPGGIASLEAGKKFCQERVKEAEDHAASRERDLAKLDGAGIGIVIAQEAATLERSRKAKASEDKGGRPSPFVQEAREIAGKQTPWMKKGTKASRAKDIHWKLLEAHPMDDVPTEEAIRRWDIFGR